MNENPLLTHVVSLQGADYEAAVMAAEAMGGSVSAVVEYLARWDTGDEVDRDSAEIGDSRLRSEVDALPHQVHEVTFGGLDYVLVIDHQVGLYALYRPQLEPSFAAWPHDPAGIVHEALRGFVGDGDGEDKRVLAAYDALPPASLPEPDFEAPDLACWATDHGLVVADNGPASPGVYLHPVREDRHPVEDPEGLIAALRAAVARMDRKGRTP